MGRVSLVTGGTDGIGRAVALDLARGGDRVLIVGRNERRGADALRELEEVGPGLGHAFLPADLSLLAETARLADEIVLRTDRLDGMVLCAGVLAVRPEWTAEDLERSFVLNYLTRYLLVRRLLPRLVDAPSGRLVLVSSAGMYGDTLDFDDLQHRRGRAGLAVAGRTQFANDLFATELASRLAGTRVEVTCLFPGRVATRVIENARGFWPWLRALVGAVQRWTGLSVDVAKETPLFLAADPGAVGVSGRFYGPRRRELRVPERALRPDRRQGLWDLSEALVGEWLTDRALNDRVA